VSRPSDPVAIRRIRLLLSVFAVGLILSGVTAFPLVWETKLLDAWFGPGTALGHRLPDLAAWIARVHAALEETSAKHPFLAYGTDWLAFAHLVIAVAFWGPISDPVRNEWVIDFGLIACAAILPLALIAGPVRGIPFYWRLIDCSFGIIGCIPLILAKLALRRMRGTATASG
jgi:hypothetical protein